MLTVALGGRYYQELFCRCLRGGSKKCGLLKVTELVSSRAGFFLAPEAEFLTTSPSIWPFIYLSVYLCIYLSIHPSIHPSIYLPTYLPIYLCLFIYKCLFILRERERERERTQGRGRRRGRERTKAGSVPSVHSLTWGLIL